MFFKGKAVMVKVVPEEPVVVVPRNPDESVKKIMDDALDTVLIGTGAIIGGYVAADTLRKVIIHIVKVKVR